MSAVISTCGTYRYWLERWPCATAVSLSNTDQERADAMIFLMANPSTADATVDDPTIRKCRGFAKRHGFARIVVVNVLAARATKPDALLRIADPVGPENAKYLRKAAELTHESIVVCAWGNAIAKPLRKYIKPALDILQAGEIGSLGRVLYCLGRTADGSPRHPLMLSYDTPLVEYMP